MKAGEMLKAAIELVDGQRAKDYGDKYDNHERISKLWTMWMWETRHTRYPDAQCHIKPYDVAMMMLMVKIARLMHSPGHPDSHLDIAGYASILEEIARLAPDKDELS
jgi:hypothetical protein